MSPGDTHENVHSNIEDTDKNRKTFRYTLTAK